MLLGCGEHDGGPAMRVSFTSIGPGREHLRDERHVWVALSTFISQMAPGHALREGRARRDGRIHISDAHFSHGVYRRAVAAFQDTSGDHYSSQCLRYVGISPS